MLEVLFGAGVMLLGIITGVAIANLKKDEK